MKFLLIVASLFLSLNAMTVNAIEKQIKKEVTIRASLEDAWKAWTTIEGAQTFFAPVAEIELKPGGAYNILWSAEAPKGERGAEDLEIISLKDREMLSFTWSAPPNWPTIRNEKRTRVTISFEAVSEMKTKVTLVHDQWGEGELNGEKWDEVYDYFMSAWNSVLGRFVMSAEGKPVDWKNSFEFKEVIDANRVVDRSHH